MTATPRLVGFSRETLRRTLNTGGVSWQTTATLDWS
ncbi:hypothetical protein F4560_001128 [Saccharothrix ecbatanensis]|uniref:Uncharacterized protein n=1 Tax=Saccharothrix ecbatanensis TaxID=1105145 RepID=A0A7W9HFR4_9PSEU|nr:hypothetical protein [Saccharothrix ecbatanensis]